MPQNNIDSLVRASRKGDPKRVKQLLDSGIDMNASTKVSKLKYPLNEALVSENFETIKLLVGAGADPSNVLHNAIRERNKKEVELLLRAGADANIKMHGETPLVTAASFSNPEVTELLLDYGADINNAESNDGFNALSTAILAPEDFDIVRLLLKRRANVNAQSGYGSILQTAISRDQIEIVKILLSDERIHINAAGGEVGNAFEIANELIDPTIINMLREHEEKLTKPSREDNS